MPDHGTGAIRSPHDDRDVRLSAATLEQLAGAVTLPPAYRVPTRPPITDQGLTPMCVAYSSAYEQNEQDEREHGKFFNFDEPKFFYSIGGGPGGAVVRYALQRMLHYGYPEQDSTPDPAKHQISGYFQVPLDKNSIKRAIMVFGGVLIVGPWYDSWSYPVGPNAVLPSPSGGMSGHAWWGVGWDRDDNIVGQQTWGTAWGDGGLFRMNWWYVTNLMWEIWKTADEQTVAKAIKVKIPKLGITLRTRGVLGDDGKLEGTRFATTTKAGIRRIHDPAIIATPHDKAFVFKGFKDGARHGIGPQPRRWATLEIRGTIRCVAKPFVELL